MAGNGEAWSGGVGSKAGAGARRLLASFLPQSCRSEDWPLPSGGGQAKRHLRDLRLVPSGDKVQASVSGCGLGTSKSYLGSEWVSA